MIRVAFVFSFDSNWMGGINYYRNLLDALYDLSDRTVEVVAFTSNKTPEKYLEGFPNISVVRSSLFSRNSVLGILRRLTSRVLGRDVLFELLLKCHKVKVLSHSGVLSKSSGIRCITWIPDFQHILMPEFFSKLEFESRTSTFKNWCLASDAVIVSSKSAQSDLENFDYEGYRKSLVLPFVVSAKMKEHIPVEVLQQKFGFEGRFLLLPNQFWKHKNHSVVINALRLLKQKGKAVLVISTGNTQDFRHPDYFVDLMSLVQQYGIEDFFRVFGLVSNEELASLMDYAVAIINPSYFEGWSTTVEESKALGKPILLSNISVHKEQDPALGRFFDPDNPTQLADLMLDVWENPLSSAIDTKDELIRLNKNNRKDFALQYQKIVTDVYEHRI